MARTNDAAPWWVRVASRWGPPGIILCGLTLLAAAGCAATHNVTGFDPKVADENSSQSETALTTAYANGQDIVVAAYNDGTNTGSTILYTATTRTTLPGASLMGWSYSLDDGRTWQYGGKVLPPEGWAALWGDPALTTSRTHYSRVFMSNLAIPSSKMPPGGINGPVNNYIGGACVARSTDGGKTFQVYAMLTNDGHFYDGGSMAAAKSGEIYAAFVDVDTDRIDVWRAKDDNSPFERLPNPFPNKSIYSHPRIRTSPFDGTLYVAAQAGNYVVYMTRWVGGNWQNAVAVSDGPAELYPELQFSSGTKVRTGAQFSFDIGAASAGDKDAIRVGYTKRDPVTGRLYVICSYGPLDLPGFWGAPQWGTTPGNLNTPGDQFNPNVTAWQGFIGLPPVWKMTYLNRDPGAPDKLDVKQGNLAYLPDGGRIFLPFDAAAQVPICPDTRGYCGDYDDLVLVGFSESGFAKFLRTYSDSSLGCIYRWGYTSHHLHISAAVFH